MLVETEMTIRIFMQVSILEIHGRHGQTTHLLHQFITEVVIIITMVIKMVVITTLTPIIKE